MNGLERTDEKLALDHQARRGFQMEMHKKLPGRNEL